MMGNQMGDWIGLRVRKMPSRFYGVEVHDGLCRFGTYRLDPAALFLAEDQRIERLGPNVWVTKHRGMRLRHLNIFR
jgi:hypothetical protein